MLILSCPKYLYQTILLDISTFRGYQIEDRNPLVYILPIGETLYRLIPSKLSAIFWKGFLMSVEFGKNVWEFVILLRKGCLLVCYNICRAAKLSTEKSPTCGEVRD
jgi:hypothetical protein